MYILIEVSDKHQHTERRARPETRKTRGPWMDIGALFDNCSWYDKWQFYINIGYETVRAPENTNYLIILSFSILDATLPFYVTIQCMVITTSGDST